MSVALFSNMHVSMCFGAEWINVEHDSLRNLDIWFSIICEQDTRPVDIEET